MKRKPPYSVDTKAKELGAYLAQWRKINRITSAELADRAGVSRTTISKMEHGDMSVSAKSLLSVLNVLGIINEVVNSANPIYSELGRIRLADGLSERVRK